jgi:hypothetical protein
MKWRKTEIQTSEGPKKAIAPEIISASRATDIPAFYDQWFMNRLRQGYVKWINPFNNRPQYVSLERAKAVIFWSKNPRPMMELLPSIDERGLAYYFQFTLNDCEGEGLEAGVPPLTERIATFRDLSARLGRDRVIWRIDPLVLTQASGLGTLVEKVKRLGDEVAPYTTRLVFSFVDIAVYRRVRRNLKRRGIECQEFDEETMASAAMAIGKLCAEWGITASTCAEPMDFSAFGVEHGKCIDDDLILRITGYDPDICRRFGVDVAARDGGTASSLHLWKVLKDPGQRAECRCVVSKDIGQYNTCPHLCAYCYANASEEAVKKHVASHTNTAESIVTNAPA